MKSVLLRRLGGPEVLEIADVPRPCVRSGEVLVRVKASGVNYFEILMRKGSYASRPPLPMALGVEVAGIVEEAGENAGIAVGSRVAVPLFASGLGGGYAQFVAVDARMAHPIPDGLSFEKAAALLVQGLSALHAVRRVSPQGRTVLIPAAAGGVGSLLVQLARRHGARRIIAAVGAEWKLSAALALGADAGLVYQGAGWGATLRAITDGKGVDAVYDFVGGKFSDEYLPELAPQGELLFGALGRADLRPDALNALIGQSQTLRGMALIPLLTQENVKSDLAELFRLAADDQLQVPIGARYRLDEAAAAHRAMEERETIGKVILLP
jgi:NADPH2:quinone reductase